MNLGNYDNPVYDKLYVCIGNMIASLSSLGKEDRLKIEKSMEVNSIIKEFKIGKGIKTHFSKNEACTYVPLMSHSSRYLKTALGFSIYQIIIDNIKYMDFSLMGYDGKTLIKYINNELFNIINYNKTSIKLFNNKEYMELINIFIPIVNRYREMFRCVNKKTFHREDLDFSIISKNKFPRKEFSLLYVIPECGTDVNIDNISLKTFGLPVIIDNFGMPINKSLWNAVYMLNKKFGTRIPIRCLVPSTIRVRNGFILNQERFINGLNKYIVRNLTMVPIRLEQKISILLLSTADTAINKVR